MFFLNKLVIIQSKFQRFFSILMFRLSRPKDFVMDDEEEEEEDATKREELNII